MVSLQTLNWAVHADVSLPNQSSYKPNCYVSFMAAEAKVATG